MSESACPPWRSGYEPRILLSSLKQKKDAEASSFNVDNSFEISNFKIWRSDLLETINTIQLFSKISLKENMSLTTTS